MKRIKKYLMVCFILIVFLVLIFATQSFAQPEYKWRFAMPWERETASQSYELFCDLVGVYSDGRIEIEYFPHALLGPLDENFHAIQSGEIEMGMLYPYANLVPGGPTVMMPFSVLNFDEEVIACSNPDGILYQVSKKAWEEVGFHLLFLSPQGFLGLGNKVRPLKTPDDLKNLKMRVSGSLQCVKMLENMGKGTGMTMETLPWADVYNALEKGVMDGIWTTFASLIEERHYEVLKYFTDLRHTHDVSAICINKEIWDKLPDDLKTAIEKAAKIAEERDYEVHRRSEVEFRKTLLDKGVEIYTPTNEELSLWIEKANVPAIWEQVAKPWLDKAFPGENIVEKILDELNKIHKFVGK